MYTKLKNELKMTDLNEVPFYNMLYISILNSLHYEFYFHYLCFASYSTLLFLDKLSFVIYLLAHKLKLYSSITHKNKIAQNNLRLFIKKIGRIHLTKNL